MNTKPTIPFLRQLIGNPTAYAEQREDGGWNPVRRPLTPAIIARHMRGEATVGTYITYEGKARTLVFDIDDNDQDLARAISLDLIELGVPARSIGIEFSGRKGYHVWVVTPVPVAAAKLQHLGHIVRDDVDRPRLEVFPKQAEEKDLGSLVKLPGGVHRVSGKRNDFITPLPFLLSLAKLEEVLSGLPEVELRARGSARQPFPCMGLIQQGLSEGGRNNALFHFAVMMRRHGMADDLVEHAVRTVNARNEPPLDEWEVTSLLESSKVSGPVCGSLPEEAHCGDACILLRQKGLYTRPGQLRYAAEGEHVVMQIERRDGGRVNLSHEDLASGVAVLRDTDNGN